MKPYIVSVLFGDSAPEQLMSVEAIIAPSREAAVALFVARVVRATNTDKDPCGVAVAELEAGFLEAALRAARGKMPESGTADVLALVPKPPSPVIADHAFVGSDVLCSLCGHEFYDPRHLMDAS